MNDWDKRIVCRRYLFCYRLGIGVTLRRKKKGECYAVLSRGKKEHRKQNRKRKRKNARSLPKINNNLAHEKESPSNTILLPALSFFPSFHLPRPSLPISNLLLPTLFPPKSRHGPPQFIVQHLLLEKPQILHQLVHIFLEHRVVEIVLVVGPTIPNAAV